MPVPANFKGKKGRSGAKKREVVIAGIMEQIKEKVTQQALIELANDKVYKALNACKTIEDIKALGLPITLKGITERIDHTSKGESIVDNTKIERLKELANMLRKKND